MLCLKHKRYTDAHRRYVIHHNEANMTAESVKPQENTLIQRFVCGLWHCKMGIVSFP